MSDYAHKHAIVGAGFCGLGVAAAFKKNGIALEVFEADDDLGGNWKHGVYETVHIISSRKTTEYSDWPMPTTWPDFPSAEQMLSYLRGYADHHGLREHIAFNTRVQHVAPVAGDRWEVTLESGEKRVYGGIVVCNGHHWDKRIPEYPGKLTIPLVHSKDYKSPRSFDGKRVLVLGGGNSACDIAVEAARFAKSAHVSMRRGYWFLPKTMLGIPTIELMKPWMPVWTQKRLIKGMVRLIVGRYEQYGLEKPDHDLFEHHPTINSELLYHLRHGRITAHPDVERWDGDEITFVNGKRERFDAIVAATGYNVSFPFLADGVVRWKNGMPQLIGGVVPDSHKNIYVFGVGQPRYGAGPLISAGADLLCSMVTAQQQLANPIGAVLRKMGARPPRSYLVDPFAALRQARIGKRFVRRLPSIERLIMRSGTPSIDTNQAEA